MLGICLIICLCAFWLIHYKKNQLLNENIQTVKLSAESYTYHANRRAIKLGILLRLIVLAGYIGCAWPYLFIQGIDRASYWIWFMYGFAPVSLIIYSCYSIIRSSDVSISINIQEIQLKGYKPVTIKVENIKKIHYQGMNSYYFLIKEKGKMPFRINIGLFCKRQEIQSLFRQIREYSAKISGRDKQVAHRLYFWKTAIFLDKSVIAGISILLLYTSYCCIDYDYFKKDYTASYNALHADPNQSENAWPYYVQAATNYKGLESELQEAIKDQLEQGTLALAENQIEALRKWAEDNTQSWSNLKKAAAIEYCNATYQEISMMADSDRHDFSTPSNHGYEQIKYLYVNAEICRLIGILEDDWHDLFNMQLSSARHFMQGKCIIDQLAGHSLLVRTIKFLGRIDQYSSEDLDEARKLVEKAFSFPDGLPLFHIEGEVFICAKSFENMINYKIIPLQTPLNPFFLLVGSCSGSETYVRNRFEDILQQAKRGTEPAKNESMFGLPPMRKTLAMMFEPSLFKAYKLSQQRPASIQAGHIILDLEEYRLRHDGYPAIISQLRQAGFNRELPNDPYSDNNVIYHNDGQRAVLYSVGKNGKDDGGYKDEGSGKDKRDDVIYWQRTFNNKDKE